MQEQREVFWTSILGQNTPKNDEPNMSYGALKFTIQKRIVTRN